MMQQLKTTRLCAHFILNMVNVSWNDCANTSSCTATETFIRWVRNYRIFWMNFLQRRLVVMFQQVRGFLVLVSYVLIIIISILHFTVFLSFEKDRCLVRFVFFHSFFSCCSIHLHILHLHTKFVKSNSAISLFYFTETVIVSLKYCFILNCTNNIIPWTRSYYSCPKPVVIFFVFKCFLEN